MSTENWSSSDGEAELYYKMSDDEDIKGDKWIDNKAGKLTTVDVKLNVVFRRTCRIGGRGN